MCLKKYKKLIKTISLLVIFTFLWNNYIWAQGIPEIKAASPASRIPEQYAGIKENWQSGGNKDLSIIHIQDSHANYEAQMNIARILEYIIYNHPDSAPVLIAVEGAAGPVDTSLISSFGNENAKRMVSDYLCKEGLMTGDEYFSALSGENGLYEIYGVEDADIYLNNVRLFKDMQKKKKKAGLWLKKRERELEKIINRRCSKRQKEFISKYMGYHSGYIDLSAYIYYIFSKIKKNNIAKLVKMINIRNKIDYSRVDKERMLLLRRLKEIMERGEFMSIIKNGFGYQTGSISAVEYFSYLEGFLGRIEKKDDLGNLLLYIDFIKLESEIDTECLFEELMEAEEEIAQRLLTTWLFKQVKQVVIINKFLELRIYRQDLSYLEENTGEFRHYPVSGYLECFRSFCETAIERDRILAENTLRKMRRENMPLAILITGGFHTKGIKDLLVNRGISYTVVSPKTESLLDRQRYASLLLEDESKLAPIRKFAKNVLSPLQERIWYEAEMLMRGLDLREKKGNVQLESRVCNTNISKMATETIKDIKISRVIRGKKLKIFFRLKKLKKQFCLIFGEEDDPFLRKWKRYVFEGGITAIMRQGEGGSRIPGWLIWCGAMCFLLPFEPDIQLGFLAAVFSTIKIAKYYPPDLIERLKKLESPLAPYIRLFELIGRERVISTWVDEPHALDSLIKTAYYMGINDKTGELNAVELFRKTGIALIKDALINRAPEICDSLMEIKRAGLNENVLVPEWMGVLKKLNVLLKSMEIQEILNKLPPEVIPSLKIDAFMMIYRGISIEDIKDELTEKYTEIIRAIPVYIRYLSPVGIEVEVNPKYRGVFPVIEAKFISTLLGIYEDKDITAAFEYNSLPAVYYGLLSSYFTLFRETEFIPRDEVCPLHVSVPYRLDRSKEEIYQRVRMITALVALLYTDRERLEDGIEIKDIIRFKDKTGEVIVPSWEEPDWIEKHRRIEARLLSFRKSNENHLKAVRSFQLLYSCYNAYLKKAKDRDWIEKRLAEKWREFAKRYRGFMSRYERKLSSYKYAYAYFKKLIEIRDKNQKEVQELQNYLEGEKGLFFQIESIIEEARGKLGLYNNKKQRFKAVLELYRRRAKNKIFKAYFLERPWFKMVFHETPPYQHFPCMPRTEAGVININMSLMDENIGDETLLFLLRHIFEHIENPENEVVSNDVKYFLTLPEEIEDIILRDLAGLNEKGIDRAGKLRDILKMAKETVPYKRGEKIRLERELKEGERIGGPINELKNMINAFAGIKINRDFESFDSTKIRITEGGNLNSEITLLFIHGLGMDARDWRNLIAYYEHKYKIITMALKGMSETAPNITTCTKDIYEVINQLDLKNVILIGHSMGGVVILNMDIDKDNRILGAIPIATTAGPVLGSFLAGQNKEWARILSKGIVRLYPILKLYAQMGGIIWDRKIFKRLLKSNLFKIAPRALAYKLVVPKKGKYFDRSWSSVVNKPLGDILYQIISILTSDAEGKLKETRKPILWIIGTDDYWVRAEAQEEQVKMLKNVTVLRIIQARHFPMIYEPAKVISYMDKFIKLSLTTFLLIFLSGCTSGDHAVIIALGLTAAGVMAIYELYKYFFYHRKIKGHLDKHLAGVLLAFDRKKLEYFIDLDRYSHIFSSESEGDIPYKVLEYKRRAYSMERKKDFVVLVILLPALCILPAVGYLSGLEGLELLAPALLFLFACLAGTCSAAVYLIISYKKYLSPKKELYHTIWDILENILARKEMAENFNGICALLNNSIEVLHGSFPGEFIPLKIVTFNRSGDIKEERKYVPKILYSRKKGVIFKHLADVIGEKCLFGNSGFCIYFSNKRKKSWETGIRIMLLWRRFVSHMSIEGLKENFALLLRFRKNTLREKVKIRARFYKEEKLIEEREIADVHISILLKKETGAVWEIAKRVRRFIKNFGADRARIVIEGDWNKEFKIKLKQDIKDKIKNKPGKRILYNKGHRNEGFAAIKSFIIIITAIIAGFLIYWFGGFERIINMLQAILVSAPLYFGAGLWKANAKGRILPILDVFDCGIFLNEEGEWNKERAENLAEFMKLHNTAIAIVSKSERVTESFIRKNIQQHRKLCFFNSRIKVITKIDFNEFIKKHPEKRYRNIEVLNHILKEKLDSVEFYGIRLVSLEKNKGFWLEGIELSDIVHQFTNNLVGITVNRAPVEEILEALRSGRHPAITPNGDYIIELREMEKQEEDI